MNLYRMSVYDGETSYLVFADSPAEARKIIQKYLKYADDADNAKVSFDEETEVKKGIIGDIDWTEPEPPLFREQDWYESK